MTKISTPAGLPKHVPAVYRLLSVLLIFVTATMACGQRYITPKEFADKLHSKLICSDSNYRRMIADIENNNLGDQLNYLNYCDKATIVYLDKYAEKPAESLEQIHRDVSRLLPQLAFTDFSFQIVLDSSTSDKENEFYNFIVSLKSNGKIYQQKSFYELYSVAKKQHYADKIDQQNFYKIFNKVLADIQSPYRLHEVKASQIRDPQHGKFGIIALTKEQADMLHGGGVMFSPSYENFKNSLTSESITNAIEQYKKIGLLSHLSADEIKSSTEGALQQENRSLNDVLRVFPRTVFFFDTELGNLNDPYAGMLKAFSAISKGAFMPTNITDNFAKPVKGKALVKFTLNGKQYAKQLKVDSDWVDPDFFEMVKQAVADNKLKGQFYDLYTGGQEASVIFLTPVQYKFIKENKLLVFGDEWQGQEEF